MSESKEMNSLLLFRGIQGSGKSTVANALENYDTPYYTASTVEADGFRNYNKPYDPSQNEKAHTWCRLEVERRMNINYKTIFCANTFSQEWEIAPYRKLAEEYNYRLFIIRVVGEYENIHNVPEEAIKKLQERFEDVKGEIIFDNTLKMENPYCLFLNNENLYYLRQGLVNSGVCSKSLRYIKPHIKPPNTESRIDG